jgi:hypothetical protein
MKKTVNDIREMIDLRRIEFKSESYILGYDHNYPDKACMVISKLVGSKTVVINALFDKAAESVYDLLIENKYEKVETPSDILEDLFDEFQRSLDISNYQVFYEIKRKYRERIKNK